MRQAWLEVMVGVLYFDIAHLGVLYKSSGKTTAHYSIVGTLLGVSPLPSFTAGTVGQSCQLESWCFGLVQSCLVCMCTSKAMKLVGVQLY